MKEKIGMQHAQAHLPEILRRVAAGEHFIITNRGKPVADLSPRPYRDPKVLKAAIARIRSIRKSVAPMSDERLKEMLQQGRT